MKTAVSIPDELFHRAEALARREGKSRSQVYQEALVEHVASRQQSVTDRMNQALELIGSDEDLDWVNATSRQVLERVEWEE